MRPRLHAGAKRYAAVRFKINGSDQLHAEARRGRRRRRARAAATSPENFSGLAAALQATIC